MRKMAHCALGLRLAHRHPRRRKAAKGPPCRTGLCGADRCDRSALDGRSRCALYAGKAGFAHQNRVVRPRCRSASGAPASLQNIMGLRPEIFLSGAQCQAALCGSDFPSAYQLLPRSGVPALLEASATAGFVICDPYTDKALAQGLISLPAVWTLRRLSARSSLLCRPGSSRPADMWRLWVMSRKPSQRIMSRDLKSFRGSRSFGW